MAGNVIVLDGDGVGPEVLGAAYRVLERLGTGLDMERPLCGEAAVARGEPAFPQEVREMCLAADAVLFGATGSTSRDILTFLRWGMDNYINMRPIRYYGGTLSPLKDPDGIDFVILRENSEQQGSQGRGGIHGNDHFREDLGEGSRAEPGQTRGKRHRLH